MTLVRAFDRGELPANLNVDVALDLLAAPLYSQLAVRPAPTEADYLEEMTEFLLRALGAS